MNVLLIDDDSDDIELFREAVYELSRDIVCWTAKDGEEGLKMLTQDLMVLPDYIFLDVNMPVMDGKQTLTKIKQHTRLKTIPVFMYSTTSNDHEISHMKNLGARDFVIKPPTFERLVKMLKSVLLKGHIPISSPL